MSQTNPKGLGRGLESLIPTQFDSSLLLDENERVQNLFISDIITNSDQPRKHFDEQALTELAASIKQYGVLQPIIVSPGKDGKYRIVAGERRWRASKLAGLNKIPAIIRKPHELEELEIALIENVQRVDLSPIEQAVSIERLHQQFNMSYSDIARRMGKATSTLNNIVRLLQLPKEALTALEKSEISEGHARAILALKGLDDKQSQLLHAILSEGLSVRQAEQFVQSNRLSDSTTVNKVKLKNIPKHYVTMAQNLSLKLKVPVNIRGTKRGGKIEIKFKSDNELKSIIEQITKS